VEDYLKLLHRIYDFGALRRLLARKDFRFTFDGMHGVAGPYAQRIFVKARRRPAAMSPAFPAVTHLTPTHSLGLLWTTAHPKVLQSAWCRPLQRPTLWPTALRPAQKCLKKYAPGNRPATAGQCERRSWARIRPACSTLTQGGLWRGPPGPQPDVRQGARRGVRPREAPRARRGGARLPGRPLRMQENPHIVWLEVAGSTGKNIVQNLV